MRWQTLIRIIINEIIVTVIGILNWNNYIIIKTLCLYEGEVFMVQRNQVHDINRGNSLIIHRKKVVSLHLYNIELNLLNKI